MSEKINRTHGDYFSVIKVDDTPMAYFFAARWANKLLPWAAAKDISPNSVTVASLLISLLAGFCFTSGSIIINSIGSVILIFAFVLDCLDGQLARYTNKTSVFGYYLDIFGDRVREPMLWTCMCVGFETRIGDGRVWMWGMPAVIALGLRVMEDLYREKAIGKKHNTPSTIGEGTNVSIRTWIQRFLYFSIAERMFFLAIAAPLGLAIEFFKIVGVGNLIMALIFSTKEWRQFYKNGPSD